MPNELTHPEQTNKNEARGVSALCTIVFASAVVIWISPGVQDYLAARKTTTLEMRVHAVNWEVGEYRDCIRTGLDIRCPREFDDSLDEFNPKHTRILDTTFRGETSGKWHCQRKSDQVYCEVLPAPDAQPAK